jgi:hypothetical protein
MLTLEKKGKDIFAIKNGSCIGLVITDDGDMDVFYRTHEGGMTVYQLAKDPHPLFIMCWEQLFDDARLLPKWTKSIAIDEQQSGYYYGN